MRTRITRCSIALAIAVGFTPIATRAETDPATPAIPTQSVDAAELKTEPWQYPRERTFDGNRLIVYAPQIRTWPDFASFSAVLAIEFQPKDGSAARFGTLTMSGATEVDLDKRLVIVTKPKVDDVTFAGAPNDAYEKDIQGAVTRDRVEMPLDVFLLYLADDVLEDAPPAGFNDAAPPIHVVNTPTLLLFVNGEPVLTKVDETGLELVVNANFPLFRDNATKAWFLITGPNRLRATNLDGPWKKVDTLPAAFSKIDRSGPHAGIVAAIAAQPAKGSAPKVIRTKVPAELIVLDGRPKFEAIPGTGGLEMVTNTETPLFVLNKRYYALFSGRWFSANDLTKGPWSFVHPLPEAFSAIPTDSAVAAVRASVPGTLEAKTAALEALLPTRNTVQSGSAPAVQVVYSGEPTFEPIPNTSLARAVNTSHDVIRAGADYYLCYQGAWYVATTPTGPWSATATIPAEIYKIPASSPAYPVTQVVVQQSTPQTIVYSYPPSYSEGIYVVYGVPWYGTGWYYPPYIYGGYYYPYWGSYGHGYWYSPVTGAYGSRSVWYGPYGGYSYSQGYNPNTGRYGYVETAWNGSDWQSHSEKYNPRTGIATETSRHYSANDNMARMSRTVEGQNGAVQMERKTDFDNQTMTTNRETSRGGSSSTTRTWDDGTVSKSGTVTTGGGKTATVEGEHQIGEGGTTTISGSGGGEATIDRSVGAGGTVTREGSYSKDGQTLDTQTARRGDTSVTKAEGSGGGQAASINRGGERTSVVQSGSGDVYAGSQGNVYKKTDNGWQHYDNGGWQDVQTPERSQSAETRRSAQAPEFSSEAVQPRAQNTQRQRDGSGAYGGGYGDSGGAGGYGSYGGGSIGGRDDLRQLDRDARARSGGYDRYEQRRGASGAYSRPSGGYSRPSGGFSRGGGGGMRGGGGRRR